MNNFHKQFGATLMEVLITMVIMLFGLVGLSQLFIKAQRTTTEAYDRHRALTMANQMAEMTRTMMRGSGVLGSLSTAADTCPAPGVMPDNGVLSNEQTMACFFELSHPNNETHLGRFSNDDVTDIVAPIKAKKDLADCTSSNGCDGRDMVSYLLNNWTESLAGYSQVATSADGQVYANRNFAARGCIEQICDTDGRATGCGTNSLSNIYRVRVYWRSDEAISQDAAYHYCSDSDVNDYWRYTFVDIAIPTPSVIQ